MISELVNCRKRDIGVSEKGMGRGTLLKRDMKLFGKRPTISR